MDEAQQAAEESDWDGDNTDGSVLDERGDVADLAVVQVATS